MVRKSTTSSLNVLYVIMWLALLAFGYPKCAMFYTEQNYGVVCWMGRTIEG